MFEGIVVTVAGGLVLMLVVWTGRKALGSKVLPRWSMRRTAKRAHRIYDMDMKASDEFQRQLKRAKE